MRPAAFIDLRSERGTVILWIAMGLMLLLLMTGFAAVNLNMVGRGARELQLAVDNTAISAANVLCTDKPCYEQARKVAIDVISRHAAISSIGSGQDLDISDVHIPDNEYTWDLPGQNLRITIERGVWSNGQFQSFEGDWQAEHPGIPAFVAANSVRIKAERPDTWLLGLYGAPSHFALAGSAVAVKGSSQPTGISPFAIPVCALINNAGEYYGAQSENELCVGDRNFTRSDRYNRSGFMSAAIPPAFPWAPCNSESGNWPYETQASACESHVDGSVSCYHYPAGHWPHGDRRNGILYFDHHGDLENFLNDQYGITDPISPVDGVSCSILHGTYHGLQSNDQKVQYETSDSGWVSGFGGRLEFYQPYLSNGPHYDDLFGVVGLPGPAGSDIETEIQEGLTQSSAPTWSASLGDEFHILGSGLTSNLTDSLLWNAVINGSGGSPGEPDNTHPALKTTTLRTFDRVSAVFKASVVPWDSSNMMMQMAFNDPLMGMFPMSFPAGPIPPEASSNGYEWFFGGAASYDGICNSKWMSFDNFQLHSDGGVWEPYYVTSQTERSAQLSDDSPVMHVTMPVIADPATDASGCLGIAQGASEDPRLDPARTYKIIGFVDGLIYDTDIGNPKPEATFDYSGYTHRLKGYAFMDGNADVPSCNIVRGRLSCKRWFVPDAGLQTNPNAALVN